MSHHRFRFPYRSRRQIAAEVDEEIRAPERPASAFVTAGVFEALGA